MATENVCKDNSNHAIDSIMRWIVFGIIIVVAPPLLNVWYRIIVGFYIDFIEYIPDMLLVMLSVSCNLLNTCVDGEKRIARWLRWILGIVLVGISFFCWGLFFAVRIVSISEWYSNDYYMNFAKNLFYISSGVVLGCAIIGIVIEWYTVHKNNK